MISGLVIGMMLVFQTPMEISGDGLILEVHGDRGIREPRIEYGELSIEGSYRTGYLIRGRSTVGLIYIPESSDVVLRGHGAGISLVGLKGRVSVETNYSDIKVLDFDGTMEIVGKGNQLALMRCRGRIQGKDELGDIKIIDSRGIVDITGELSRFEMTRFEGSATIKVNGWLKVRDYRGPLMIDSKFVKGILEDIEGTLQGTALSGTLRMRNVRSTGIMRKYKAVIIPVDVEGIKVMEVPEIKIQKEVREWE